MDLAIASDCEIIESGQPGKRYRCIMVGCKARVVWKSVGFVHEPGSAMCSQDQRRVVLFMLSRRVRMRFVVRCSSCYDGHAPVVYVTQRMRIYAREHETMPVPERCCTQSIHASVHWDAKRLDAFMSETGMYTTLTDMQAKDPDDTLLVWCHLQHGTYQCTKCTAVAAAIDEAEEANVVAEASSHCTFCFKPTLTPGVCATCVKGFHEHGVRIEQLPTVEEKIGLHEIFLTQILTHLPSESLKPSKRRRRRRLIKPL